MPPLRTARLVAAILAVLPPLASAAAVGSTPALPRVEVTSSKLPTELARDTSMVSVIDGEELRARGARDLRTALALVAGVQAAPGGDGGPASSVPAFWGLQEFDAFLLLVDGVPWGGAFVPALASLDLVGVERIEVMKGAAPVSYGASSFVGVINVIHYAAGSGPRDASVGYGSQGSATVALSLPLRARGELQQTLLLDGEHQDLSVQRAGWDRGHALYRLETPLAAGRFRLDADLSLLRQEPTSPVPRAGGQLSPLVPIDSNQNPADARLDQDRGQLGLVYVAPTRLGTWDTRLSATRAVNHTTRGFLSALREPPPDNAAGYDQDLATTEFWFDTHVDTTFSERLALAWGADWQYGKGKQDSANFDYGIALDGRDPPSSSSLPVQEFTDAEDERNFAGAYGQLRWTPDAAWLVDLGLRLNHTQEDREGGAFAPGGAEVEGGSDSASHTRLSGAFGLSWRFWDGGADAAVAYANYKDTFKPAVVDFGPEAEAEILDPEYATSGTLGLRGTLAQGRFRYDTSVFYMDFDNLVVPQVVDGRPGLANAGSQYFKGVEAEARYVFNDAWQLAGSYAWHDARFLDYQRLFDTTLTQLRGKAQELSPQQLGALGLIYAPVEGLSMHVTANYVGSRYLNKRNTALAPSYATVDAGIGYGHGHWHVALDGCNLSDRRDPVSESELGDGQYYRLPARTLLASLSYDFGD